MLFYIILHTILRVTYHLLYHSFAWSYDLVAAIVSIGKWKEWVKEVIPFISGPTVLEIGFGPGHLQVELIRRGYKCYGLDESEQMIRQAARRLNNKHHSANLVRGIAQGIPFKACFETVVATFPSDYIFDAGTIKEIFRVLVPGGRLIILLSVMPARDSSIYKVLTYASNVLFKAKTNPLDSRLDKVILDYLAEGFSINKLYLERKGYTLILLIGKKP